MPPLSTTRILALTYHIQEGGAWLADSAKGEHSTILAYAGFELRLALERLMLEYLMHVDGDRLTEEHLALVSSLKRVENRIYELEGHQGKIDRKFRVFQIIFEMMEMPFQLAKPNLGQCAKYWHLCSEFCHVGWTLRSAPDPVGVAPEALRALSEVHEYLTQHTQQVVAWPRFANPEANELQQRFVDGTVGEEEIRAYFRRIGIWSRVERPDGSKEFVGKAVPPVGG